MGKGQMWNSVNQWLQIDADIQIFEKYMTLSLTQELQENVQNRNENCSGFRHNTKAAAGGGAIAKQNRSEICSGFCTWYLSSNRRWGHQQNKTVGKPRL